MKTLGFSGIQAYHGKMQRCYAIGALALVAAVIFAPELKGAGEFVLAKSVDVNVLRLVDDALFTLGCF